MPEFVVAGKRMEKNDGRATPANFIEDIGVIAAQVFHGRRLYVERDEEFVGKPDVPAGR
jgi:hypothetical protein